MLRGTQSDGDAPKDRPCDKCGPPEWPLNLVIGEYGKSTYVEKIDCGQWKRSDRHRGFTKEEYAHMLGVTYLWADAFTAKAYQALVRTERSLEKWKDVIVIDGEMDCLTPAQFRRTLKRLNEFAVREDVKFLITSNSAASLQAVGGGDDALIPYEAVTLLREGVAVPLLEAHGREWLGLFTLSTLYLAEAL